MSKRLTPKEEAEVVAAYADYLEQMVAILGKPGRQGVYQAIKHTFRGLNLGTLSAMRIAMAGIAHRKP